MLGTTQLNSILFADHITFNNGYMKRAHSRQRIKIIIRTIKENKFDTSDNPGLLSYATTVTLKFKLKETLSQLNATLCDHHVTYAPAIYCNRPKCK